MTTATALALLLAGSDTNAFSPPIKRMSATKPTVAVTSTIMTPRVTTLSAFTTPADNGDDNYYIDQERRNLMNFILVGSAAITLGGLAIPYLSFFVPPTPAGAGGTITAKDALGRDVLLREYLKTKPAGDRSLVQGLQGDATYLIVKDDNTLASFGLNAVCTHLGCVVPWSASANKFICPCHGSQYDTEGAVVRGPAPLPLALVHVEVDNNDDDGGKVLFRPWTEVDFRTNEKGWWV